MSADLSRRDFVSNTLQVGAVAGIVDLSFLHNLPKAVAVAPMPMDKPAVVRLANDIEPLVRLIEETPRESLLEKVAQRIRKGTSYRELLSAVFLAGVRGIQPRPVGFKFHAVLVINSAHLAAEAAAENDRWLPLFWSLDYFKNSQSQNKTQGDWRMSAPVEAKLPSISDAKKQFIAAMDNWDEEAADRAITSLNRTAGATEIVELFWRYGARDFRDIGHKAIYVANGWRTMQTIGWRHSEPFLRSLTYALLEHEGTNPAKRDADADRPGRDNLKLAKELAKIPVAGKVSSAATLDLLETLRTATPSESAAKVVKQLTAGTHPDSLWDGLFITAGELLGRQPGIVGLHCVTTINALYFGWQTSGDEVTRRYLLLQGASFLPMFREAMKRRGKLGELRLDRLEKVDLKADSAEAIQEIFADIGKDRELAARKTLSLLERDPQQLEPLMAVARRLVFAKGTDSHDYKFSSAALEDAYHVQSSWRNRFAASALFHLKGSTGADTPLIGRTRAALGKS
jgi:hypothetical protein